ncbi:MAG: hypothetical protein AAFP78_06330, partial [Pseudomonadota bacterium]
FNITQMRAIGALIWEAHLHHAGPSGFASDHPITSIRPAFLSRPKVTVAGRVATVAAAASEEGALHAIALPAAARAPSGAFIVAQSAASPGGRARLASASVPDLQPGEVYEMWTVFRAADGVLSDVAPTAFKVPDQ